MLMSEEFVRADDKYRREKLRDQSQTKIGRVGKLAVGLVLGAMVLAACGVTTDAGAGAANVRAVNLSPILTDNGPPWQPNFRSLSPSAIVPAVEFGGMAAPSWEPDWSALAGVLQTPDTGVIGNSEPWGNPNYGRLESYLGAEDRNGPR